MIKRTNWFLPVIAREVELSKDDAVLLVALIIKNVKSSPGLRDSRILALSSMNINLCFDLTKISMNTNITNVKLFYFQSSFINILFNANV